MASAEDLKKFYQHNPAYFSAAREGRHEGLFPSHIRVLQYVRSLKGKVVGEFGCGSGHDIEQMYTPDNVYIGLDVSEGALQEARQRFAPPNVAYQQIDFEKPVALFDKTFHVLTSFYTFEHVLNPTAALNEMIRLLKPGGELFIICPNYGSPLKSAPAFGTPSKKKLLLKTLRIAKTIGRRLLFWHAPLDLSMIPFEQMDLSETWQSDMDATNEPWSWEIRAYLRAHNFLVDGAYWETQQKDDLKTSPERLLFQLRTLPLIRDLGALCVIHAIKSTQS